MSPGIARITAAAGVAAAALGMFGALELTGGPSRAGDARERAALPPGAEGLVSAVLGRDDARYRSVVEGDSVRLANPVHGVGARFDARGVRVRHGRSTLGISLTALGRGDALRPVGGAAPRALANRVEYRRAAVTEWYVNGPRGLEQGFTLPRRPQSPALSGPLTLALSLSGDLTPRLDRDARGLGLRGPGATEALGYRGLWASDARGRDLPARLELRGRRLLVRVDDAGARYPVTVDPFFQAAKLTSSDGASVDWFGTAVAVNGDTIAVGARQADVGQNGNQGAVYVFEEPAGGWANATKVAKLTASDGAPGDTLGRSVDISGDTIIAGAAQHNTLGDLDRGAAYVFVKPPGGWTDATQTAKLRASDGIADDELGDEVAIDGDTIVAGAHTAGSQDTGAAYVYVRPPGGWANAAQTAKLTASDAAPGDRLGSGVAISGNTVVAGAPRDDVGSDVDQGSVYVFNRPPTGWVNATQTAKLTASDGFAGDFLGGAVDIDGDTVVAGAIFDTIVVADNQGSAYVFVESPDGWVNGFQTAKLTASDGEPDDRLGVDVGVSGDRVVATSPRDDLGSGSQGSVYVFDEPDDGWRNTNQTAKLFASDSVPGDSLGEAVGISGDTVAAGAIFHQVGDNDQQGAVWVFVDDTVAPETTIDSGPAGPTNAVAPTFAFSSSEVGATFQCRLDTQPFQPCGTPYTGPALADGPHGFEVRAVDRAGNLDASPAARDFVIDTAAPDTAITSGVFGPTRNAAPAFAFTASEPGSGFECRVDGGAFAACTAPHTVAALPDGAHTFEARAIDAAGNVDPAPAASAFTVDTVAPPPPAIGGPGRVVEGTTATFTASVSDPGGVGADPGAVQWSASSGLPAQSGATASFRFQKPGQVTIRARATDRAGNVSGEAVHAVRVERHPLIRAGLSHSVDIFRNGRGRIVAERVVILNVTRPPAGARVRVICRAPRSARRSCAFKRKTFRIRRARAELRIGRLFKRRRMAIGTVIRITASAPGRRGKRWTYRIDRRRSTTRAKLVCLTPAGARTTCAD